MFDAYSITLQINVIITILDCFFISIINCALFLLIIRAIDKSSQIYRRQLSKIKIIKRRCNEISKFTNLRLKTNRQIVVQIQIFR